jgi:hypothetical protein
MEQVLTQLSELGERLYREMALSMSHDVGTGRLTRWESASHRLRLTAGDRYVIAGACDIDCTDLDLRLYDSGGRLLEQDLRLSDVPFIIFQPRLSGEYQIRVTMSGCSVEPCRYGLAAFSER